uniref:Cembratrien-15-ol synthase 31 n=1 Tax=Eremophila lucida TaxID=2652564 RepID=A0A6G9KSS8_9LAMI|nr:cembratrien-15-ol synthase 31 [Eremophila lucida]
MAAMAMNLLITCKPISNGPCAFIKHSKASNEFPVLYRNGAARISKPCSSLHTVSAEVEGPIARRSANFKPSFWDLAFIQSLSSEYKDDRYSKRASELKLQVGMLMEEAILSKPVVEQLELIDNLQRLGISDHFEHQIKKILHSIYQNKHEKTNCDDEANERDLYSTALEFRLLRQHGFRVVQEIFNCFKDEKGEFKTSLAGDTKGLLELYESSFLLTEGEETLDQAREFATIYLQRNLDEKLIFDDQNLSLLVRHALRHPLHWSISRTNARWFIDRYEQKPDMDPVVLELAKLDFNIVQSMHQEELKSISRWWKSTGLAEKLPFMRDRIVESYLAAIEVLAPREYGYARTMMMRFFHLTTAVDDMFDIYGTPKELQLFDDAMRRWDTEVINQLPDYMQICYLAINNFVNEVAYNVLKEQGSIIIPYLRDSFVDIISSYYQEAKWYHNGQTPSMEEYLENGWRTGGYQGLQFIYFLTTNPIKEEAVQSLYEYHNIIRLPSLIARLVDDIGTHSAEMERGDVAKAIQCHMNETGASEKESLNHIMSLIRQTWKKLNSEIFAGDSTFSRDFITCCVNTCRLAHFLCQDGDCFGSQNFMIKDQIGSLLFKPISI